MARRRGRYKMTPRRRAALKKAQAASARKRRGAGGPSVWRTVGSVAGTIAVGAAIYHAEQIARHPNKVPEYYRGARSMFSKGKPKGPDPNAPGVGRRMPIRRQRKIKPNIRRKGVYVAGRRISNRQRSRLG